MIPALARQSYRPGLSLACFVAALLRLDMALARRLAWAASSVLIVLTFLFAHDDTYRPALIALIARPLPRQKAHSRPLMAPLPDQSGQTSAPAPGMTAGASSPQPTIASRRGWPIGFLLSGS
jgi:hypothetical protein